MILGRDFIRNFGVVLDGKNDSMTIGDVTTPIKFLSFDASEPRTQSTDANIVEAKHQILKLSVKLAEENMLLVPSNSNSLALLGLDLGEDDKATILGAQDSPNSAI